MVLQCLDTSYIITNDLTCINLLNFYNQNMLENWVYFAFWLWKSLSYNAIDNYITIKILLHFCQYTISFFRSKSMSILSRSDSSSNQCKFMFAILLQLLLLLNYVVLRALWKIDAYLISTLVNKSLYYIIMLYYYYTQFSNMFWL